MIFRLEDKELEEKIACGSCVFWKREGRTSWGVCGNEEVDESVIADKPIETQQNFGCKYFEEAEE